MLSTAHTLRYGVLVWRASRGVAVVVMNVLLIECVALFSHPYRFFWQNWPPSSLYPHLYTAFIIFSSDNTTSQDRAAMVANDDRSRKRKGASTIVGSQRPNNLTSRPSKECQSNWSSPEVMSLIHSKEKEHAATKLTTDAWDNMEIASIKWKRIIDDVHKASFLQYYWGVAVCKNKWQGLFRDYKKIKDYKEATVCNEDYFRMGLKRRKKLYLLANFYLIHYKEMD